MSLTAEALLAGFEVPGHSHWYTVGFGASRVTVYSQQVRALNLAWALKNAGRLSSDPILVVGAGAAGLTVAASLARLGARVTVLERERDPLPLQRNCYKRHLHPHIFDWPRSSAAYNRADLPLLNWKAGMAKEVALSIESGFDDLAVEYPGRLALRTNVHNLQIDVPGPGTVSFRDTSRRDTLPYAILVFAIGFGVENSFWSGKRGSYWADDSIDQHGIFEPGRYLVSGTGDGGLIDVLRILLQNFRQDDLARLVEHSVSIDSLREQLIDTDEAASVQGAIARASQGAIGGVLREGQVLFERYQALPLDALDRQLQRRLTRDVHVTLLCRHASPFSLASRPLHRLLLSRLLFSFPDQLDLHCNTTLTETMLRHDGHSVVLSSGGEQTFNHVIIRHGFTNPTVAFPALDAALRSAPRPDIPPEPQFGDLFGPRRGPIAWGAGPGEYDYLDELKTRFSTIAGPRGQAIALKDLADVFVELREDSATVESTLPPSSIPPPHLKDDEERAEVPPTKQQGPTDNDLQRTFNSRFISAIGGTATVPSRPEGGLVLLRGGMGTGKSTFLKRATLATMRAIETGAPWPLFISVRPDVSGARRADIPSLLVDAALRSIEMPTYSRAASFLRSRLLQRSAIVYIDAVDAWSPDELNVTLTWLSEMGVDGLLAARRFPALLGDLRMLPHLRRRELIGIAPSSVRRLLATNFPSLDADAFLKAIKDIPNAELLQTNPFLLTQTAAMAERSITIDRSTSLLSIYEQRIADALAGVPAERRAPVTALLRHLARADLRNDSPRFTFPRTRIPLDLRDDILSTQLLSGDHTLEFSHLSIGEYLAAEPPLDLRKERDRLLRPEATWQHYLDVLAMSHARSDADLESAFVDSCTRDFRHRRLALVLRAMAFGGAAVFQFCARRANDVVREILLRLEDASGRYGDGEHELLRIVDKAIPFLTGVAGDAFPVPLHGEPKAEGTALVASLQTRPGTLRPEETVWWPTIFHQARALVHLRPEQVWTHTRGGDRLARLDAARILKDSQDVLSLLVDRNQEVRHRGVEAMPDDLPRCYRWGLWADDNEWVRLRAIQKVSASFWLSSTGRATSTFFLTHDPSPLVRSEVIGHLEDGTLLPLLLDHLHSFLKPRKTISSGEQRLLAALLSRLRDEARAEGMITSLLTDESVWFCPKEAYQALLSIDRWAQALRSRLEDGAPDISLIEAVAGNGSFAAGLRTVIDRLLARPNDTYRVATAIRSLPLNDDASREHRLRCLRLDGLADRSARRRHLLQAAAIASFKHDPQSLELLSPFLATEQDDHLIIETLRAIGRHPDVRHLVWLIARTTNSNASAEALTILGEDAAELPALREFAAELDQSAAASLPDFRRLHVIATLSKRLDTAWCQRYLFDSNPSIRDVVIASLWDRPEAEPLLRERALRETSPFSRARLWQRFVDQPEVKEVLRIQAREDQREVRHAYYLLLSRDETRLQELRSHFGALRAAGRTTDLTEMFQALARDEDALPELRSLIDSKDLWVRLSLLQVLGNDALLRSSVHTHVTTPEWIRGFALDSDHLVRYFAGDTVGRQVILEALGAGKLDNYRWIVLPILRHWPPAETYLRQCLQDPNDEVRRRAQAALADCDDIFEQLCADLKSEDENTRKHAAEALEDLPRARPHVAQLRDASDKGLRLIAYQALVTEGLPEMRLEEYLVNEREPELRAFLAAHAGDPGRSDDRMALRAAFATDYSADVRRHAVERLADPGSSSRIRERMEIRNAVLSAGQASSPLWTFLRSPRPIEARNTDRDLFVQVVSWLCAKLVSTMPSGESLDAELKVDDSDALFGEIDRFEQDSIVLRIAMDSADLPRNRNIWPAANTVIAWEVAKSLRPSRSLEVLLVCGDIASAVLPIPPLGEGEIRIGPSIFGFRTEGQITGKN